jgi:Domain of unknown function (DUF4845)
MHRRQRGVTAIGWLFLLLPIAIVGYAGVRLTPVYLNYMKVARSMEQLASSNSADEMASPLAVRRALERFFDIESVDYPKLEDIVVRRDSGKWIVQAEYDDSAPLFANLSILVQFDKTVTLE